MKKIQVLGMGCPNCNMLASRAEIAAKDIGIAYELEKVTDVRRFAEFGVMVTPALVVDGTVKVSGRVPSIDEIKEMLA
jgi:small redox-active disulfide protein 2